MLKAKRDLIIRDLCRMFNFVLIMGRKDASLKINLGVPFKTNERASEQRGYIAGCQKHYIY
jgi:hypothetical protein